MNGFMKTMEREPQTDEEALSFLDHPFTTQYLDFYKELRGKGISIKTSLLATLEMRMAQLTDFLSGEEKADL